jgi:hypothetical protein
MTKMLLTEDDDMIKALPSDRTDKPFRIAVLPWRLGRNRSISDPHRPKPPNERFAVGAVAIANEVSWRLVPATSFGQLPRDPFGVRMGGHSEPQKFPARMPQDQEAIQ